MSRTRSLALFFLISNVAFSSTTPTGTDIADIKGKTGLPDELASLFGESSSQELWKKDYLQSEMSIRLVLKDWRPSGPSSETDEKLDVYKWSVDEAFNNLKGSSGYEYAETMLVGADELFTQTSGKVNTQFDKSLPSIMIIHPLSASADVNYVQTIVAALAMRNLHRYNNLFVVDMPLLNINMFLTVLNNAMAQPPMFEPVAEALGDFFVKAIQGGYMRAADTHLIGWSYSGQLVGYMGRYIKDQVKEPIGTILALDPIGNAQNPYLKHVNKDDAKVVHIYHSNSFPCGTLAREGTADFTFNNGMIQPECATAPLPMLCSHFHVVQRFWYVVLYGQTIFKARQCDNIMQFNSGACDRNPTTVMTYPIIDSQAKGEYFLRTTHTKPYGAGDQGSLSSPQMKQKIMNVLEEQRKSGTTGFDFMVLNGNSIGN